nr:MAG TPA: hypothetical protein [Caudoviricetes sp.]
MLANISFALISSFSWNVFISKSISPIVIFQ